MRVTPGTKGIVIVNFIMTLDSLSLLCLALFAVTASSSPCAALPAQQVTSGSTRAQLLHLTCKRRLLHLDSKKRSFAGLFKSKKVLQGLGYYQ